MEGVGRWRGAMLLAFLFAVVVGLSGCIELVGNVSETNKQIAQSNNSRFTAFAQGMVGCGDDAACKVGLAMAFAGGMGQQNFYRPDSVLDWVRALNQPLDTLLRYTQNGDGNGGATGSLVLRGDQNVVNVGNSAEHRGTGTLTQDLSTSSQPYKEQRTWVQDGYAQGNGTIDSHNEGAPEVPGEEVAEEPVE